MPKFLKNKINIMLIGFLVILYIYILFLPPLRNGYNMAVRIHFFIILYTVLSTIAFIIIDIKNINKKYFIYATIYGFFSMFVFIPSVNGKISFSSEVGYQNVIIINLVNAITASMLYLLSVSINSSYKDNKLNNIKFNLKNTIRYFIIVFLFIICFWALRGFKVPSKIKLIDVISFISAGISEEIIFRLFPYSVALRLGNGELSSKKSVVLLMTIPFTLIHFLDAIYVNGIIDNLFYIVGMCVFQAIPITVIFFRRDLFSAILIHLLFNICSNIF